MGRAWPIIFTLALLIYPAWLGAHHASVGRVAIFALIFAVCIFVAGPKSNEVQHNPSKAMLALFALVLASGLAAIGYGFGYGIFG
jgi:hypothetical protein